MSFFDIFVIVAIGKAGFVPAEQGYLFCYRTYFRGIGFFVADLLFRTYNCCRTAMILRRFLLGQKAQVYLPHLGVLLYLAPPSAAEFQHLVAMHPRQ